MIVKDKFSLLKDKPNILNLSSGAIKAHSVENGQRKLFVMLDLETKISHFAKKRLLKLTGDKEERKKIAIVTLEDYVLPVSYNKRTDQMIINLSALGATDITPTSPDPRTLYSSIVYAFTFYNLITEKFKVNKNISSSIINYLLSVFVRVFGKDYGLLAAYASEIPKLKFLIACYVYESFFGFKGETAYRAATTISMFDYHQIKSDLDKFDFTDIDGLVNSLSYFRVMPGLNRHLFAKKFFVFFGINFLPALEDLSRFISILTTSTVSGTIIVPTFISIKYNQKEFNNILEISRLIFKRK